jgi:pilus assembly protein CpaE
MTAAQILVVDDSKLSAQMIQDRLIAAGYQVIVANSGEEALVRLRSFTPDLILSDVVMPGINGYELVARLRQQPTTAHTPVIMLTSKGGIAEKTKGFEAGADDYLVKPVEPAELELRIRALLARVAAQAGQRPHGAEAQIISVFSLKGGTGVSTIAVNLAVALAQMWQIKVPLVDLNLESGQAAMMLDIKAQNTLAQLATTPVDDIDAELLSTCLIEHQSGVSLLPAPLRPELAEQVTSTAVNHLLSLTKGTFDYLVLDLPSTFSEVSLTALDHSSTIIVVFSPDLAAPKATTDTLNVFKVLGYPPERIVPILNRTFPRGGLPQKNLEAALKRKIPLLIPHEPSLFVESINRGVPAILRKPRAAAPAAIAKLAYAVSRDTEREHPPESRPSLLAQVLSE